MKILLVYSLFFYCNILFGATNSIVSLNNNKLLLKTYGDEFNSLNKEQKQFLINNIGNIMEITKKNLKYPKVAYVFNQSGINKCSFILFPNGNIEEVRIIESSGFPALDKNSILTIKSVHKQYPMPKEKSKIILLFNYIIH